MDPRELATEGYLAALNLEWAHPLGLEVLARPMADRSVRLEVRDHRSLPGGLLFGESRPERLAEKLAHVAAEREKRAAWRREHLGGVIEQVPGVDPDPQPVEGFVDPGADWQRVTEAVARIAADAHEAVMATDVDATEGSRAEQILARVILDGVTALLTRLRIDRGRRAMVAEGPAEAAPSRFDWLHRARWLIGAIGELQAASGQLYPDEAAEVERIAADVHAADAVTPEAFARLEVLYGMAQPGMRFFRGDRDAIDAFDRVRPALQKRVREVLDARGEFVRLVEGDMAASDVRDPEGVLAEVEARLEPLATEVRAQREEIAAASRDLGVDEARVAKLERVRDLLREQVASRRVLQ